MAAVTVGTNPGEVNLTVVRGDTLGPLQFAAADFDWSGRTWEAQVRSTRDEPTEIVATFTVDASSAADGLLLLTLPADESANLVTPHPEPGGQPSPGKGTYFWDLQATQSGVVKTWFRGKISVLGDVTVSA